MSKHFKHVTITIERDDNPPNPFTDYDMAGKLYLFHSRYDLGHPHDFANETYTVTDEIGMKWTERYTDDLDGLQQWIKDKRALAIPCYLYDHGGITMRAGSPGAGFESWDTSMVGYICITPEQIRHEWGKGKQAWNHARKCLLGEVKQYDDHLTGNCWGYVVCDNDGNHLDSCWGFLGDEKYCREEAERIAEYHNRKISAELGAITRRLNKVTRLCEYAAALPVEVV